MHRLAVLFVFILTIEAAAVGVNYTNQPSPELVDEGFAWQDSYPTAPWSEGRESQKYTTLIAPLPPGYDHNDRLPWLIDESKYIVIGKVGNIVAREQSFPGYDYAFHDILVLEKLKGKPPSNFLLARTDPERTRIAGIDIDVLEPGITVLLFVRVTASTSDFSKLFSTLNAAFSDIGMFDIEGNRAYPRMPEFFQNDKLGFYHPNSGGDPYYELGELKSYIKSTDQYQLEQEETDENLDSGFIDISNTPHAYNIGVLAQNGISRGCNPPDNTKYCPDRLISRDEMATYLSRSLKIIEAKEYIYHYDSAFQDIGGNIHQININRIAESGISQGCNPPQNTRYCPDRIVTL